MTEESMTKSEESSERISAYEAGDYFITAASWICILGGKTYEIGIRRKKDGKFWLCTGDWNHQTVQDVANAMAMLLSDKTQCYEPEWCQEHFK